jgi:hypothetical protein
LNGYCADRRDTTADEDLMQPAKLRSAGMNVALICAHS